MTGPQDHDRTTDRDIDAGELSEADLEALAHGRRDLLGDEARAMLAELEDGALDALIASERAMSDDASLALRRVAPELPDLDALVSRALQHAPDAAALPPTRRSLFVGGVAGIVIAGISGTLAIARYVAASQGVLDPIRDASGGARTVLTLGTALDRAVQVIPGGWGAIGLVGLVMLAALILPLRVLGAVRAPRTAAALGLGLAIFLASGGRALAWERAGEWPAEDPRVTVDVDHVPLSQALRQLASSASLGMTYSLASDPEVSAHLADLPLSVALDAMLGDETPARVRHLGSVLVIEAPPAPALEQQSPREPAPPPTPVGATPQPAAQPGRARLHDLRDLVTFGGDAHVTADEEVRDVITMGGDALVEGRAYGSVVTMGGDADIRGEVIGDVITMGGDIDVAEGGRVHGELQAMGGDIEHHGSGPELRVGSIESGSASSSAERAVEEGIEHAVESFFEKATQHALLFLLGIVFLGLAPTRMSTSRLELRTRPLHSLGMGLLGLVAGVVLMVVLTITIIGIPVAFVLGLVGFLAMFLGLALTASVIGIALPIKALENRPVHQLAAGITVLFVVSLVPVVGFVVPVLGTLAGLGALLATRAGERRTGPPPAPRVTDFIP